MTAEQAAEQSPVKVAISYLEDGRFVIFMAEGGRVFIQNSLGGTEIDEKDPNVPEVRTFVGWCEDWRPVMKPIGTKDWLEATTN